MDAYKIGYRFAGCADFCLCVPCLLQRRYSDFEAILFREGFYARIARTDLDAVFRITNCQHCGGSQ